MDQQELLYWVAWNKVPGIGPVRFYKLLKEYGKMSVAWKASAQSLTPIIGDRAVACWKKQITLEPNLEDELKKADANGFIILCFNDANYPLLLKKIPDPPPVLYSWGKFEYGDDVAVAIVGTRNPTPMGAYNGKQIAMELSRQGLTVVSGMARGIDSEAHRGALEAKGRTIAVLGSGLNVCYPKENYALMEQIAQNGMVLSEFALDTQPLAQNFPARNRIISGLSLGVVVVEATDDSGSLITAEFAMEQGREVFAIPGSIGSEGSKGPHKLIRQGAKLVENSHDILEDLAIPYLATAEISAVQLEQINEMEMQVYKCLSRDPMHINQITRISKLGSGQVNSILIQLELSGLVKSYPGQLYLKIK